jgi:superfamily I DNA/RNA helicase
VEEFRTLSGDKTMLRVGMYEAYDRKTKKMLMDFDDLLMETHKVLKEEGGEGQVP